MLKLKNIELERPHFKCCANFEIPQGQRVVLMGKSGAGKSSLLSVIGGFEDPSYGQILIQGEDVTSLPARKRPITTLFQNYNLFPHLTVFENVCLGLKPSLQLSKDEKTAVQRVLEQLQVSPLRNKYPGDISGGEAQRTALARSFLRPHSILLMDEPFTGLGPRMRQELILTLKEIQGKKGMTMIMATHQPEEAKAFGDRLLFIEEGDIILDSLLPEALDSCKVRNYLIKN